MYRFQIPTMASMLALQSAASIQLRVDIGRHARVIQLEGSTKGAARRRRKEQKTHEVSLFSGYSVFSQPYFLPCSSTFLRPSLHYTHAGDIWTAFSLTNSMLEISVPFYICFASTNRFLTFYLSMKLSILDQ